MSDKFLEVSDINSYLNSKFSLLKSVLNVSLLSSANKIHPLTLQPWVPHTQKFPAPQILTPGVKRQVFFFFHPHFDYFSQQRYNSIIAKYGYIYTIFEMSILRYELQL